MSGQHLLIAWGLEDQLVKRIRDDFGFDSVKHYPTTFNPQTRNPKAFWLHEPPDIPDDVWAETTVLMTMFLVPESRAQAPHLKFIQGMSAGLEHMLKAQLLTEAPEIRVASASGVHATAIGEYVLMQSLNAFHKQNLLQDIQASNRSWARTRVSDAVLPNL